MDFTSLACQYFHILHQTLSSIQHIHPIGQRRRFWFSPILSDHEYRKFPAIHVGSSGRLGCVGVVASGSRWHVPVVKGERKVFSMGEGQGVCVWGGESHIIWWEGVVGRAGCGGRGVIFYGWRGWEGSYCMVGGGGHVIW